MRKCSSGKGQGRTHKPQKTFRRSTHVRITEGGAEALANVDLDLRTPNTTYALPLTLEALEYVNDFAFRAMIERQYENWENSLDTGLEGSEVSPDSLYTPEPYQEIYLRLLALEEVVTMSLGGIHTVYDSAESEIITVAAAHARGYTTYFTPSAIDTDIFIVVHAPPNTALLDATYGNDIAHIDDNVGKLAVFGGKVVRDEAAPDIILDYGQTPLTRSQSVQGTGGIGQWVKTSFLLPYSYSHVTDPTTNCCLPAAQPPSNSTPLTPPVSPPSGTLPPPAPNTPIKSETVCSSIFQDIGHNVDVFYELLTLSMTAYSNVGVGGILVVGTYPANLGAAIHTWIATFVPDFDFNCDVLLSVFLKLHVTLTDGSIFGYIPNPIPQGDSRPTLVHKVDIDAHSYQSEPIYFFPVDRSTTQGITNILPFPSFKENFYENEHEIAIRNSDRVDGIGTEKWAFAVDASDYRTALSVNPLDLQMCGIKYRKHQYEDYWLFDGSDPVRIVGGITYLYGQMGNARIQVATGFFEGTGFDIFTDGLHDGFVQIDWICDLAIAGTNAVITGTVTQLDPYDDPGTFVFFHVAGIADPSTSNTVAVPKTATNMDFSLSIVSVFPAHIGVYQFGFHYQAYSAHGRLGKLQAYIA